jgi:hypothetical protein
MAELTAGEDEAAPVAPAARKRPPRRDKVSADAVAAILARLPKPVPSGLAKTSLRLALFAVVVTVLALLVVRSGRIEPQASFSALGAGLLVALAAVLIGAAALVEIWRRGTYGAERAFGGILVGLALLAVPAYFGLLAVARPAITDVTTDTDDPPRFDAAVARRRPGDNPTAYPGPVFAEQQAEAYPYIVPLRLAAAPEEVQAAALQLAAESGWRILERGTLPRGGGMTGRIEMMTRTPVLGFADDIVLRVRPDGTGSRVDMRSASRVGRHDLGRNAERIREFLRALPAAVTKGPSR